MEQFKLLTMTGVLTCLIWATADSLLNETSVVGGTFDLVSAVGERRMIVMADGGGSGFKVELSGPRKFVSEIPKDLTVSLRVSERPTGTYDLDLKELMGEQWREHPKVSVLAVDPPVLRIHVDHTVSAEVQVAIKSSSRLAFDQAPRLDHQTVKVDLRESALSRLEAEGRALKVEVDADRALRGQTPGRSVSVGVGLSPDVELFGEGAKFDPPEVKLTAALKADRRTAEITTCPIQLAVGFAHFGRRYRIEDDKGPIALMTRTITVTGPVEAVDKLLAGDRPVGIIRLRAEDFEQGDAQRSFTPEFHLPPEVELEKPPEPVVFKLVEVP